MTDWQKIEFDDIREGDRIRQTWIYENYTENKHARLDPDSVTLELDPDSRPPEPEIEVGAAGTATVRDVRNVRVLRSVYENGWVWTSAEEIKGWYVHRESHVYDFVPDTLLTDEAAEKIRAEERERLALAVEKRFRYREVVCGDGIRIRAVMVGEVQTWLLGGAR